MNKARFSKRWVVAFMIFAAVAFIVLSTGSAVAQEYSGQVTWVFTLKSSGTIPIYIGGAYVTFTRVATGWKQTGYTSAGEITFSYVATPGEIYVTTAEKSGYRPGRWEDKFISPGNWESLSSIGLEPITSPPLPPRPPTTPIVGEIAGRVVNTAWQVITNASIRVDNIPVTFDIRDGHFIAGMIPAGIHTVYYDAPGYISQTQIVNIVANMTTNVPTCLLSPVGSVAGATVGTGEIFGRVVDYYDQTIPGTCIRINSTIMPTNAQGEFRFTLVYPGIYTIYYDAPGHRGQTQVVEVRPNSVTTPPKVVMYTFWP